jgi:peptide deformylase
MTIHRTRRLGDPILRERCQRIAGPRSPAARVVADDLRDTLRDWRERGASGRGISAPQIGAPIRLVLIVESNRRRTLVNPEIVDVGDEDFLVWDECCSFPDLMVHVLRAYRITVKYEDFAGKTHMLEAEGPLAELLQHEIDHLDGVLAVDRASGLDPFCLREEWSRHWGNEGRCGKPTARELPRPAEVV